MASSPHRLDFSLPPLLTHLMDTQPRLPKVFTCVLLVRLEVFGSYLARRSLILVRFPGRSSSAFALPLLAGLGPHIGPCLERHL